MLRKLLPSSIGVALVLGLATPAFADVPPDPTPAEPPAPEQPPAPEVKAEPPAEAKPEPKADDKKAEEKLGGSCSIDDSPDRGVLGLAVMVLLISGTALGRRRA